jgi:hypothetical protein
MDDKPGISLNNITFELALSYWENRLLYPFRLSIYFPENI